jgi:hypothetical protein
VRPWRGQGVLTYPPPPRALADDEEAEDAAGAQGACYAGELVHGVRQGRGRYTWPPGAPPAPGARPAAPGGAAAACACYEGCYAAGLREGQGTMTYPDGGRYEGAWRPCSPASARTYGMARARGVAGYTLAPALPLAGLHAHRKD